MNSDMPEGSEQLREAEFRRLLGKHHVPEPSADFVADTLLCIQIHAWQTPKTSPDFVERVVGALAEDRSVMGAERVSEKLVSKMGLMAEASQPREPVAASRTEAPRTATPRTGLRFLLPACLAAAAVILAFLLPSGIGNNGIGNSDLGFPTVAELQDPWLFAEQGSNTVGRMIALLPPERSGIQTDETEATTAGIIPAIYVPPAPGPGIAQVETQSELPFELDQSLGDDR